MPNNGNGKKSGGIIGIIILVIIVFLYMRGIFSEEYDYSSDYQESTSSYNQEPVKTSFSWFDILFGGLSTDVDYSKYEDKSIKNSSTDKYTVMIYMCGSNLESDGGYASADIEEMLKSTTADELNILVYTGGARYWYDFGISNKTNQIYEIKNHNIKLVKDGIGIQSMGNPNTLANFMKFAKENYPANKYALILWDHGGGAVEGFGEDQNANKKDHLTIDEMKTAISSFGSKLEFVGFDACLMANMETAYALKDNANYLIASEETESGTGWDYIKMINNLSRNTSQTGDVTSRTIIDSFIASNSGYRDPDSTLSCIDLSKMDNVYSKLVAFMKDIKTSNFDKKNYNTFSKNLARSKSFGEGEIDTVDLIDFVRRMNTKKSNELITAAQEAIYYNKTNGYVQNANGMSIFIPNKRLKLYDEMLRIYKNIGIGEEYYNTLNQYANLVANGRNPSYTVNNHSYQTNDSNYSSFSWFDLLFSKQMSSHYEDTKIDASKLYVQDKGDYYALSLSKKDWDNITKIESVVWYDDGKGYIDMGADSYYELDNNEDLIVESDGTWLAINGNNIHYEVNERTENYELGKVPALVNKERVNLVLYFDADNPDGEVLGYEPDYGAQEHPLYERGLRPLIKGDKIDFIAPYYGYEGEFEDEYYINDTLIVGDKPLVVSYEDLGEDPILIYYRLTDVYGNIYYTEPVILE